MSWGYIPKKLKRQRRQRLLRKKYKNFSCDTCSLTDICCSLEKLRNGRVKFCIGWKKANKVKNPTTLLEKKIKEKSKKSIFIIKGFFK